MTSEPSLISDTHDLQLSNNLLEAASSQEIFLEGSQPLPQDLNMDITPDSRPDEPPSTEVQLSSTPPLNSAPNSTSLLSTQSDTPSTISSQHVITPLLTPPSSPTGSPSPIKNVIVEAQQESQTATPTKTLDFSGDNDTLRKLMERHRKMMENHAAMVIPRPPSPEPEVHAEPRVAPLEPLAETIRPSEEPTEIARIETQRMVESAGVTHAESHEDPQITRKQEALRFLENIVTTFLSQLTHSVKMLESGRHGSTARKRTPSLGSQSSSSEGDQEFGVTINLLNRASGNPQRLVYPSDSRTGGVAVLVQMTRILFVASVLYERILCEGLVTKRDIYYHKKELFGNQRIVDKIIDDLVSTADLKRQDFCVCATSKGLIASNTLRVTLSTGEELPLSSTYATLIPPEERIANIDAPEGLEWVLVVEKDAVMQTLCGACLLDDERLGPGAVITGKGYPDLSTQQLLRRIADTFPNARIYALVDADPHGIDILSVYTFGSKANRHSDDYRGLPLGDRLEWIGVKATDITSLASYDDLLPLATRDIQLAIKMCTSRPAMPSEWRRELTHMVHLHRKAEIQILCGAGPNDELENILGGTQVEATSIPYANRLVEYIVDRIRG